MVTYNVLWFPSLQFHTCVVQLLHWAYIMSKFEYSWLSLATSMAWLGLATSMAWLSLATSMAWLSLATSMAWLSGHIYGLAEWPHLWPG